MLEFHFFIMLRVLSVPVSLITDAEYCCHGYLGPCALCVPFRTFALDTQSDTQ